MTGQGRKGLLGHVLGQVRVTADAPQGGGMDPVVMAPDELGEGGVIVRFSVPPED